MREYKTHIDFPKGMAETFIYAPEAAGAYPGVIFYTDIFGIRPASQGMAQRLADAGFIVLMPNAFWRHGRLPIVEEGFNFQPGEERSMKLLSDLFASLDGGMMEQDAPVYARALLDRNDVAGEKIGVVGYCYTGAFALRTAAVVPDRIGAAASFHGGRLVTEDENSPHTRIAQVKGELYFGHAIEDQSATPADIAKLEDTLKGWGGAYQSELYEGARHGWTVPGRDVYNEKQAERAFAKMVDLFQRTLV